MAIPLRQPDEDNVDGDHHQPDQEQPLPSHGPDDTKIKHMMLLFDSDEHALQAADKKLLQAALHEIVRELSSHSADGELRTLTPTVKQINNLLLNYDLLKKSSSGWSGFDDDDAADERFKYKLQDEAVSFRNIHATRRPKHRNPINIAAAARSEQLTAKQAAASSDPSVILAKDAEATSQPDNIISLLCEVDQLDVHTNEYRVAALALMRTIHRLETNLRKHPKLLAAANQRRYVQAILYQERLSTLHGSGYVGEF